MKSKNSFGKLKRNSITFNHKLFFKDVTVLWWGVTYCHVEETQSQGRQTKTWMWNVRRDLAEKHMDIRTALDTITDRKECSYFVKDLIVGSHLTEYRQEEANNLPTRTLRHALHTCMLVRMHACMCACMHVRMYVWMYWHVCMYVFVYVSMLVWMYVYTYVIECIIHATLYGSWDGH